jgi:hypothetical protein
LLDYFPTSTVCWHCFSNAFLWQSILTRFSEAVFWFCFPT